MMLKVAYIQTFATDIALASKVFLVSPNLDNAVILGANVQSA
jgi:hypothetical protein